MLTVRSEVVKTINSKIEHHNIKIFSIASDKKNKKAKKLVFAIIDGVEYKKPIINVNEVGGVQEVDTISHPTGNASNLNGPPSLPTEKSVVSVDVSAMDPLPIPTFNFESNERGHLKTNRSTSSDVMNPLFEDSYDWTTGRAAT